MHEQNCNYFIAARLIHFTFPNGYFYFHTSQYVLRRKNESKLIAPLSRILGYIPHFLMGGIYSNNCYIATQHALFG